MGEPRNYSLEIPQRCLQLIDGLWDEAAKQVQQSGAPVGPLTSTFLLSMSSPILNFPIERLERAQGGEVYADDRGISPNLTQAMLALFGRSFSKTPFYREAAWSFVSCDVPPRPNLAHGLADEVAEKLTSAESFKAAARMPMSQLCTILRNALAHSGVAYLDGQGRASRNELVSMYAFVSGRYVGKCEDRKLTGVHYLRVSEVSYRSFLRSWVEWLTNNQ